MNPGAQMNEVSPYFVSLSYDFLLNHVGILPFHILKQSLQYFKHSEFEIRLEQSTEYQDTYILCSNFEISIVLLRYVLDHLNDNLSEDVFTRSPIDFFIAFFTIAPTLALDFFNKNTSIFLDGVYTFDHNHHVTMASDAFPHSHSFQINQHQSVRLLVAFHVKFSSALHKPFQPLVSPTIDQCKQFIAFFNPSQDVILLLCLLFDPTLKPFHQFGIATPKTELLLNKIIQNYRYPDCLKAFLSHHTELMQLFPSFLTFFDKFDKFDKSSNIRK